MLFSCFLSRKKVLVIKAEHCDLLNYLFLIIGQTYRVPRSSLWLHSSKHNTTQRVTRPSKGISKMNAMTEDVCHFMALGVKWSESCAWLAGKNAPWCDRHEGL